MSVFSYKFGELAIKEGVNETHVQTALAEQKAAKKKNIPVEKLGSILMKNGHISSRKIREILDQQMFLRKMRPSLPYETGTTFGTSLENLIEDKIAVACYVADELGKIKEDGNLFLSDGSHTYYLFLALLYYAKKVSIQTNNLGVAGEYVLRPGNITRLEFPSNGEVHRNYGGILKLTEENLKKAFSGTDIFISCEALDLEHGICLDALRGDIRRIAIDSGSSVTILSDYQTLSHAPQHHAPIFTGNHIRRWKNIVGQNYFRILTTPHPRIPDDQLNLHPRQRGPFPIPPDSQHSWQQYCSTSRRFAEAMNERFIEIDAKTKKPLQYR